MADDGTDGGIDDGLPVIIENQYGRTNHNHRGKVITYLAAHQRGLGVWITRRPWSSNRTSDETVGYARLVVVRFTSALNGARYVDFDVRHSPSGT